MKERRIKFSHSSLVKVFTKMTEKTTQEFFLHREIPMTWMKQLLSAGRGGIRVGLALVFYSILKKTDSIKMTGSMIEKFGISSDQKRRGLKELKTMGLVDYDAKKGINPLVKIRPMRSDTS